MSALAPPMVSAFDPRTMLPAPVTEAIAIPPLVRPAIVSVPPALIAIREVPASALPLKAMMPRALAVRSASPDVPPWMVSVPVLPDAPATKNCGGLDELSTISLTVRDAAPPAPPAMLKVKAAAPGLNSISLTVVGFWMEMPVTAEVWKTAVSVASGTVPDVQLAPVFQSFVAGVGLQVSFERV